MAAKASTKVECSQETTGGDMCVHDKLQHYITPLATQKLKQLYKPAYKQGARRDEVEGAYAAGLNWLLTHLDEAFDLNQLMPCFAHPDGKGCLQVEADGLHTDEGEGEVDEEMHRPTRCTFAGVTCNGWSRQSATRERFCHQSEEAHNIWIARRVFLALKKKEDAAFAECVVGYDFLKKFLEPLMRTHEILIVPEDNPLEQGRPVRRPRFLGAAMNRLTTCCTMALPDWLITYKSRIQRTLRLAGDVYFVAEEEERLANYGRLAAVQSNYPDKSVLKSMDAKELVKVCLPQSASGRLDKYIATKAESYPEVNMIADLDQNDRSGMFWPCMLTHGHILLMQAGGQALLATGMEHMGAHGWHLFPATTLDFAVSKMKPIFARRTNEELKVLAGRALRHQGAAAPVT